MRCKMNDRKKLFKQIQVYSFAVYETALYLDGHPNDCRALEYYRKKKEILSELCAKYEKLYGPLTIRGNDCDDEWKWTAFPWPWELDSD